METNKSKVIVLGASALGVLLIAGMAMLMFGKDPEAPRPAAREARTSGDTPAAATETAAPVTESAAVPTTGAPKPGATEPAPKPASAAQLAVRAPREAETDESAAAQVPPPKGVTAQDQWNNERNSYTIQFQEKLNELEYRRIFMANAQPIERARHEALITLYRDSMASMQNGDAANLATEVKRVHEEEKQILRGARDSQIPH